MTRQPQLIADFIEWKNGLQKEIRGGVLMFDVKGHYKWLSENELFDYYISSIDRSKTQ